jgi:hypothetical protein
MTAPLPLPRLAATPAAATARAPADPVRFWGPAFVAVAVGVWAAGVVIGHNTALGILTAIGFAAAVLGLYHPTVGLLGIGMLCTLDAPMRHFLMTGGLFRWNTFNYWLVIVIVLAAPFLLRLRDPHTRLMRLLLFLFAAQLLVSPDLEAGVQDLLNAVAILGVMAYFGPASRSTAIWLWLALLCAVLGAMGGLVFYLQRDQLVFINPNAWSAFPVTALFAICLGFPAAAARRGGQLTLAMLGTVNAVWVFLSGSRGNMLIAACCALLVLGAMRGFGRRLLVLAVAVTLGVVVSTQFIEAREQALVRIDKLVNPQYNTRQKTSGRADLLLGGWYMFLDHPLGVGTGGFRATWEYLGDREGMSGFAHGWRMAAHSAWIKVLAENGVPGGILLGAYVVSFTVAGWRQRYDRDLLVLGVLVTVTLSVAWISTEFQGKGLWLLAGGAATLLHRRTVSAALPPPVA